MDRAAGVEQVGGAGATGAGHVHMVTRPPALLSPYTAHSDCYLKPAVGSVYDYINICIQCILYPHAEQTVVVSNGQ